MKTRVLCNLGIHRPLKGHTLAFIDRINGDSIYRVTCPCGKKHLTDSPFSFPILAMVMETKQEGGGV